jgi:chromosome segregation ATPase
MVTLDQIRNLEAKVQRTVAYISELKDENSLLQKNLEKYRERIDELEVLINGYKEDQNEIEQGIMSALSHLDRLEDDITGQPERKAEAGESEPIREIDDIEGKIIRSAEEAEDTAEESPDLDKKEGELDIF